MGMDLWTTIVVGLTEEELPKLDDETLIPALYEEYPLFDAVRMFDTLGNRQTVIGFEIATSKSSPTKEIDFHNFMDRYSYYKVVFHELFDVWPKLYLLPVMDV